MYFIILHKCNELSATHIQRTMLIFETMTGGQMFVLSKAQIQKLLHQEDRVGGSLLDIGAGDGNVTTSIASLVDTVRSTEVSPPMVKNLNKMGFNAVETCDLDIPHVMDGKPYNIIRWVLYLSGTV